MKFEVPTAGLFCLACGSALVNGLHVDTCKPQTEMCAPLVSHQPDLPHPHPSPWQAPQVIAVVSSSASVSIIVPTRFINRS
jgi:hypothetical protein